MRFLLNDAVYYVIVVQQARVPAQACWNVEDPVLGLRNDFVLVAFGDLVLKR